jgi:hypothetical protein
MRRSLLEFIGTLALTLLSTSLLLWASRHFNGLVVTRYPGGYSERPAHPHLAHWLAVIARAVALVGGGLALYRSPLFVAKGRERLTWLSIVAAAGCAFVAVLLYVVYWWPTRYGFEGMRFYVDTRSAEERAQFWFWLIPFVAGVVAVAGLARAGLPRAGRARDVAVATLALVAFLNFPVVPHPHRMSEQAFRSTGHRVDVDPRSWRLLRAGPIPVGIVHPYRVDYGFAGENSPTAELRIRWLGPGFGSAQVVGMCDNTILLPCWGGRPGSNDEGDWSRGLKVWQGRSGSYRLLAPLTAYSGYPNELPFLAYTFVPVVKWFGLFLWLLLGGLLALRSPRLATLASRTGPPAAQRPSAVS